MRVGGQRHAPAVLRSGKTRYPLYEGLGGPQGMSGRMRKISPPPGFDPRTVQPVESRCTDWAIPAPARMLPNFKNQAMCRLLSKSVSNENQLNGNNLL
jgi:hypothetical protein